MQEHARGAAFAALFLFASTASAQLTDLTRAPNPLNAGIAKSLADQIGAGRGDVNTPDSSLYIIARDPFRSVRRGRQLFQRKFAVSQGQGPGIGDGAGDIGSAPGIGAGLSDNCAICHAGPRGSAGIGGSNATRPDHRRAPHLFGIGLKEMLGDEMTAELRGQRAQALAHAAKRGIPVTVQLHSKGVKFGALTARPDGSLDTTKVEGVNPDLRVRPLGRQGTRFAIREFTVQAFRAELGLQALDPDLNAARGGGRAVTPAGMVLDGSTDSFEPFPGVSETNDPDGDGVANEFPTALVDHFEFYLLNYFKPGAHEQTRTTREGRRTFMSIGCGRCHVPDLEIKRDRRVADVDTVFDERTPGFNRLFATAAPLFDEVSDASGHPARKLPRGKPFVVKNIFSDLKRHDLGPAFHERNYNGSIATQFLTAPLWGIGSAGSFGHDGRSINLKEVILRHGGEAERSREEFAQLRHEEQAAIVEFLNSLVLFPPDDTDSNLNPGDPATPGYPQFGHGSIRLPVLFNDPADPE
jgi:hypothetical protein